MDKGKFITDLKDSYNVSYLSLGIIRPRSFTCNLSSDNSLGSSLSVNLSSFCTKEHDYGLLIPGINQEKIDEINELLQNCEESYKHSCTSNFFIQVITDVLNDGTCGKLLKPNLKRKCLHILYQSMLSQNSEENSKLLEVLNIDKKFLSTKLALSERKQFANIFTDHLQRKYISVQNQNLQLSTCFQSTRHGTLLDNGTITLLELSTDIIRKLKIVHAGVDQTVRLVNDILCIKISYFEERFENRLRQLNDKYNTTFLEFKYLKDAIENQIVAEDDSIGSAVEKLINLCNKKYDVLYASYTTLCYKKKEYDNLKGTEYDAILKRFLELRNGFKRNRITISVLKDSTAT